MELVGEEKRIQAAFRELKHEDQHLTPPFAAVWRAAQPGSRSLRRGLSLSFGVAVVVCLTLFSLTVWWRHERRVQPARTDSAIAHPEPGAGTVRKEPGLAATLVVDERHGSSHRVRSFRLAARRRAELFAERQLATRQAVAISSWQSPTAVLLHLPGDEILRSLPQLNNTADELKLFLPNRSN